MRSRIMEKRFYTAESVTEGHADKICDQISDAILDELIKKDPNSRVACETCVTTGLVLVMGEITTTAYIDIPGVVRNTIKEIGYTDTEIANYRKISLYDEILINPNLDKTK